MRKRDIREVCHATPSGSGKNARLSGGCQQVVSSPLLLTMLMTSGVRHFVPCNVLICDARSTHGEAFTESLRGLYHNR